MLWENTTLKNIYQFQGKFQQIQKFTFTKTEFITKPGLNIPCNDLKLWLITIIADQISVYSEFPCALGKNYFSNGEAFEHQYLKESVCLEDNLFTDSKITSFHRLLAIYSHQLNIGATAQITFSKSTFEFALCCTSFMICHPRLAFTLFLSNVTKWEERLWAKHFKAVSCSSPMLRLAKNSGTVVAAAHISQLWELF